ncbi:glycoside hydrolase family 2 TIM barrel-domain containing protein [Hymenobacter terricola]|uniref:glycoside hydrolase family 2 TIM barrel-domain containing protein n=1 Tax=Hymenobacter terricola TaxID=2819236 RepID=UPI001B3073C0|nr:glycoside hydrolase family 2 TIM barrel-domain containing protein [Hymenobacter terricola]
MLTAAHANHLTVMMGLDVARERHGFNCEDPQAVAAQLQKIKAEVLKYKDDPAVLLWGSGNELNLAYKNPKVWDAVNDIAQMSHQVDPNHLRWSTKSGQNRAEAFLCHERHAKT